MLFFFFFMTSHPCIQHVKYNQDIVQDKLKIVYFEGKGSNFKRWAFRCLSLTKIIMYL